MSNATQLELGMLALINAERAAIGLDPLRPITLLNDAAETHSQWMLEADVFSHSGEAGSTPSDRMESAGYPFEGDAMALENIGWQSLRGTVGIEDDIAQVHESLMNSPGHRANILNPEAEDIGIGIETGVFSGPNGDFEAVMVTQVFGATDADISAWIDPETGTPEEEEIIADEEVVAEEESPDETPETPAPFDPMFPFSPENEDTDVPEEDIVAEDDATDPKPAQGGLIAAGPGIVARRGDRHGPFHTDLSGCRYRRHSGHQAPLELPDNGWWSSSNRHAK
jgi:hypothetical protein